MKKLSRIIVVMFILFTLLCACSYKELEQIKKVSVAVETKSSNYNISDASALENKSSASESTSNGELNTIISLLNESLNGINNKNFTHDERIEMTTRFLENLTKLLETKESTKLGDEDLQEALDYSIVSKTKTKVVGKYNVRIVRFDGLPDLFGTLERKWTFIQWWNDKEIHSQILINRGAEVVDDFVVTNIKSLPTIILTGYLTMYKPFPVFLSTWQLNDNKWGKINVFSKNITKNNICRLSVADNRLSIKNIGNEEITVEVNQKENGFLVYSEQNHKEKIELKLENEQIMFK